MYEIMVRAWASMISYIRASYVHFGGSPINKVAANWAAMRHQAAGSPMGCTKSLPVSVMDDERRKQYEFGRTRPTALPRSDVSSAR